MKKIILFFVLILAFVVLAGVGCVSFEAGNRNVLETNVNSLPSVPPEANINVGPAVPPENINVPVDPTAGWEVYEDVPWAIEMKYPPKYKTVYDTYGWPHALVHFVEVAGAQSYRATIETWDSAGGFRATHGRDPAFIVEHPNGKNYVTVDYNPDPTDPAVAEEWRLIISTFRFTAP
jgi:hypothetical protein